MVIGHATHPTPNTAPIQWQMLTKFRSSACIAQTGLLIQVTRMWQSRVRSAPECALYCTLHCSHVWHITDRFILFHSHSVGPITFTDRQAPKLSCLIIYSVSQKIPPPRFFLTFFQNGWECFSPNFTHLLHVPIYAGLQIFIQLPALQLSTDGGHFEHIMVVALNMA